MFHLYYGKAMDGPLIQINCFGRNSVPKARIWYQSSSVRSRKWSLEAGGDNSHIPVPRYPDTLSILFSPGLSFTFVLRKIPLTIWWDIDLSVRKIHLPTKLHPHFRGFMDPWSPSMITRIRMALLHPQQSLRGQPGRGGLNEGSSTSLVCFFNWSLVD